MAILVNAIRQGVGNTVDRLSTPFKKYGLPDFGISEKIAGGPTVNTGVRLAPQGMAYTPTQNSSQEVMSKNTNTYSPPPTNPYSGGGGTSGGSTSGGGFNFSPTITSPDQSPGGNAPSELDVINSEFDSFQSFLNDQEGQANTNFRNTESSITGERDRAITSSEGERTDRLNTLDESARQGRDQERMDLAKVRQILADLDQRNNARLAISGGGSFADALTDRWARTAQQSSGQVISEGRNYQNQISLQAQRVNDFYNTKKAEIQGKATDAINNARAVLQQNLSAIAAERRTSADAKARARLSAWQEYTRNVNNARLQAATFQAQYDMWKRGVDAELGADSQFSVDLPTMDNNSAMNYATNQLGIGATQPVNNQTAYAPTKVNVRRGVNDEEEQFALA